MPFTGTFYLLDPYFKGSAGHGMTFGSGVVETCKKQNISMNMVVNEHMTDECAVLYNAIPAFSIVDELQSIRYRQPYNDIQEFILHYCKNLNTSLSVAGSDDVIWDYYTYGPIQIISYIAWLKSIPLQKRPKLLVALDVYADDFIHPDLWRDWLLPFVEGMRALDPWFRLTSASSSNAKRVTKELGVKCQWMPRPMLPFNGTDDAVALKLNKASNPDCGLIGYFADPRRMKSFDILPALLEELMDETNLRFVIQIRYEPPEEICRESEKKIRSLAQSWPERIVLIEGMMTYEGYKTAVKQCDGLLVIYDPKSHFSDTPAGTMCEALAVNTIPLVIDGTSMQKEFDHFNIDIPVIAEQNKDSFKKILLQFDKQHPEWLNRNKTSIDNWNAFQSHETLYKTLFEDAWA